MKKDNKCFVILMNCLIVTAVSSCNLDAEQDTDSTDKFKTHNSIAIIPFKNLSTTPSSNYITDGFAIDLATDLSKLRDANVIASNSILAFKDSGKEIDSVAMQLGVRYIVSGSIDIDEDKEKINIVINLYDTKQRANLWQHGFIEKDELIFDVQQQIISKITNILNKHDAPTISNVTSSKYTHNLKAYELFHKGLVYYLHRNKHDNVIARQTLEEAINLDPGFSRAYAVLANTYRADYLYGWSKNPEASLEKALKLAKKALTLNPELPQAHFVLGLVYRELRMYKFAIDASERAIELNPGYADAYVLLASVLCYKGTPLNSLELIDKAITLNPLYPTNYSFHKGQCYFTMGRYDKAIREFEATRFRNPVSLRTNLWLAATYGNSERLDDAAYIVDELLLENPELSVSDAIRLIPYADPVHKERLLFGLEVAGLKK